MTSGPFDMIHSGHLSLIAAMKYMQYHPGENIVICLSGRGDKDLATYMKYLDTYE